MGGIEAMAMSGAVATGGVTMGSALLLWVVLVGGLGLSLAGILSAVPRRRRRRRFRPVAPVALRHGV